MHGNTRKAALAAIRTAEAASGAIQPVLTVDTLAQVKQGQQATCAAIRAVLEHIDAIE